MTQTPKSDYIVAFRYTDAAGGYKGIITWSSYPSKTEFDKAWNGGEGREEEVLEEGITQERALELVSSTPRECRVAAVREEYTNPATGEVDEAKVKEKMEEIDLVLSI